MPERSLIVDLAVDRQHHLAVGAVERLGAVLHVDDRQALVGEDGPLAGEEPAPVRTAVALQSRQLERQLAQRPDVRAYVEDSQDRAHEKSLYKKGQASRLPHSSSPRG
jgi:hypothetical protein